MKPVPNPPVRDPRQTRHSTALLQRARELVEGGWSTGETARRLALEFDLPQPPARTTIRRWTEPGYAELHKRWQEKCVRGEVRPGRELTDDLLLALRVEDDLTYSAIAKVARRFYSVDLDPERLRHRLYQLGAPKNENKVQAGRKEAA